MADVITFKKNPSNHDFMRMVHEIACDRSRIKITTHAREQMKKRKILRKHVDVCLQKGRVVEPAHLNIHGNWQATMVRKVAGLSVKVAVAVETEERAIVITVMRED